MAEQSSPIDYSKLPLYGATQEQLESLRDAQQQAISALEARYAQPNLFKVAAGFLKPQLGGFGASLGSASEALAENVEQQRAQALPIAEMRARLAQSNLLVSQNKAVTEMMEERKKSGKPITPEFVSEVNARFPGSSIAIALQKELETQQRQQELSLQQRTLSQKEQQQSLETITRLQTAAQELAAKGQITPKEYRRRMDLYNSQLESLQKSANLKNITVPEEHDKTDIQEKKETPSQEYQFRFPSKLLDNLKNKESSGDPLAFNKDFNAMGAYQFIPSTVKMLHEKGIKFNPFDENESRIAADKYLGMLTDQNQGDLDKALAAYGGFKTKDPTDYINKIKKGVVDLNLPKKSVAEVKQEWLPQTHSIPPVDPTLLNPTELKQQEMLLASVQSRAAEDEKINQSKFNNLTTFSSALGSYRDIEMAKKTIQEIIKKDPGAAQDLIDAVREGGPLAAAAAAGFIFHAGSISANLSLPVNAYKTAGLNVDKRTDYDALLNAMATLSSAGMHSEGITPQNYHPQLFEQYMKRYAGIGQTAKAAYHTAMQSALKFEEQFRLAQLIREELKRTNPKSLARYTDAFNSPKVDELHKEFINKSDSLQNSFLGVKQ